MVALGARGFRGAVQLTSSRGAAVLEHVKNIGIAAKLKMLPVLKKPYETEAIVKIIQELKLGMSAATARIELEEALDKNWIEFWYQPKIDLRRKQLAGAEAYARARHPQHGVVLPGAFMPGAREASVIKLSELALASALKTGVIFSKLGVNIPLSVNIQPATLAKLPIEDIVKVHRPSAEGWPGLIIDMPESQIVSDLALAASLSKRLEPHNVRLAIDEFGGGYASPGAVRRNALCRTQARPQIHRRLRHRQGQHAAVQGGDRFRANSTGATRSPWASKRPPTRWRWSAWAAISARASCSGSRWRRSASSRCCGSARARANCRRRASWRRPRRGTAVSGSRRRGA